MKKTKITFEEYFSQIYGQRWSVLKSAMLQTPKQVIRNCFHARKFTHTDEESFDYPVYRKEDYEKVNQNNDHNLKEYYVMDPASILCAKALEIKPEDDVLDMCAAPGGKTLVLLESLAKGTLWANELSAARRNKLKKVIQDYVPADLREQVFIKGKDGNRYGLNHVESFDKILVDAPCSGEKHLLETPKELEKWSLKRTQRLSQNQYSLLCSAILACKTGGQIVYSTCSISPLENDEVIKKVLLKKGEMVVLNLPEIDLPQVEKTDYGYIILPDQAQAGPIYFSRLSKIETCAD